VKQKPKSQIRRSVGVAWRRARRSACVDEVVWESRVVGWCGGHLGSSAQQAKQTRSGFGGIVRLGDAVCGAGLSGNEDEWDSGREGSSKSGQGGC